MLWNIPEAVGQQQDILNLYPKKLEEFIDQVRKAL
jgi:hypothetical protein